MSLRKRYDARVEQVVTTTYLEIRDRSDVRPSGEPRVPFTLGPVEVPTPELNRFLYVAVGAGWAWRDRLPWDRARWLQYLDRPELETWVMYVRGSPAGYFELERQGESVEVAYFGLLPAFFGLGLGGALLTAAVARGFELGAARVWLHTCTLDHPQALANYIARGLRPYKAEQSVVEV
jgi:ribosomal protein S18 acetylase RimI-like enzyme